MCKKSFFAGLLVVLLLAVLGSMLFANERQTSSREMERLVNSYSQKVEQAYKLAMSNIKLHETQITQLLNAAEKDQIAIENRVNKGEALTTSQQKKLDDSIANIQSILRLLAQANR